MIPYILTPKPNCNPDPNSNHTTILHVGHDTIDDTASAQFTESDVEELEEEEEEEEEEEDEDEDKEDKGPGHVKVEGPYL
jgi:hypothetical protein